MKKNCERVCAWTCDIVHILQLALQDLKLKIRTPSKNWREKSHASLVKLFLSNIHFISIMGGHNWELIWDWDSGTSATGFRTSCQKFTTSLHNLEETTTLSKCRILCSVSLLTLISSPVYSFLSNMSSTHRSLSRHLTETRLVLFTDGGKWLCGLKFYEHRTTQWLDIFFSGPTKRISSS